MASWCAICRKKVDQHYVWFRGDKAHKKCRKQQLEKEKKYGKGLYNWIQRRL